ARHAKGWCGAMSLALVILIAGSGLTAREAVAQYSTLTTTAAAGNGAGGSMFEITAINPCRIYRLGYSANSGTGARTVEIWMRNGGMGGVPNSTPPPHTGGGWTFIG